MRLPYDSRYTTSMSLIAMLLALLLLQNSPQTPLGTIEGTVLKTEGTPISGAHVGNSRDVDRIQHGNSLVGLHAHDQKNSVNVPRIPRIPQGDAWDL